MSEMVGKLFGWVNSRLPVSNTFERHLSKHPVPSKVNFWYLFGALASVVLIIQIVSGIWLIMPYSNTEEEAFAMLQAEGDDRNAAMAEYSTQIDLLMDLMPSNRLQLEELVTLFFKNRGQVAVGKGKWEDTTDWTVEDTRMLPSVLVEEVEAFMATEDVRVGDETGSYEEDGESQEEEAEKKAS